MNVFIQYLIWDLKFVREGVCDWLKVHARHKCFLVWYIWKICLCLWEESISKHVHLVNELKSSRIYIAVCTKRENWWKPLLLAPGPLDKWSYPVIHSCLMNCLSEDLTFCVSNEFVVYLVWSFQMIIQSFSLRSLCLSAELVSRIYCLIYLVWSSWGSSVWWLVKRYCLANDIWSKLTNVWWVWVNISYCMKLSWDI